MKQESETKFRTPASLWLCWLLLAGGLLVLWPVRRGIDRHSGSWGAPSEHLYFSSGTTLRALSMGHSGLLADIYWTRAVQYFGRRRLAHARRFDLLAPLLRITTELDPHLLIAYRFGAIFLAAEPPEGAGEPEEALQLVRRGIVANPGYWRFWQDLGFIYYWDLKNYKMAARAFETGSRQPGAMVWMKVMAASINAQGGEFQTSRLLWSEIYRQAETETVRRSAVAHLTALTADQDIGELNTLVARFRKEQGSVPSSLESLVRAGYLRAIPLDPSGVPYVLGANGRATLGRQSKVERHLLSEPASPVGAQK
jgi:tetratricopeptide (TPR) repeat protein